MAVIPDPAGVPWVTPPRRRAAAAILALLLFLGMSLTAVAEMKVDCENDYLMADGEILTADDNRTPLTAAPPQYWLIAAGVRYPLPARAELMLSKFGLLPTECR